MTSINFTALQQKCYNKIPQDIGDADKVSNIRSMIAELSDFQANIFLPLELPDNTTIDDYVDILGLCDVLCEEHYSHIFPRIAEEALRELATIKRITRFTNTKRQFFQILDSTKLSSEDLTLLEKLEVQTALITDLIAAQIQVSFQAFRTITSLWSSKEALPMLRLYHRHPTLFNSPESLKDTLKHMTIAQLNILNDLCTSELTISNLAKIPQLTNMQANVFSSLSAKERTLENLEAISAIPQLTNTQAKVFSSLSAEERALESFYKIIAISALSEAQTRAFLLLPEEARTLANLKEIAKVKGLTDSQAKAFGYLPEDARTLENVKEIAAISGITDSQATAFWKLSEDARTLANLKEIAAISGITDSQATAFWELPEEARTLENLKEISALPGLKEIHTRAFGYLLEEVRTLENLKAISALPGLKEIHIRVLWNLPAEAKTLPHLEAISAISGLTNIQARAFGYLSTKEQTPSTLKAISTIKDFTNNQASVCYFLSQNGGEEMALDHLQKAAQLTDSQALAFINIPAEVQTLSTLKAITAIPDLTEIQVNAFVSLSSEAKTLPYLEAISGLTDIQARAFGYLPTKEQTPSTLKAIATMRGLANHQISSSLDLSSTVGGGVILGKISGHLLTQASFNSLLKQNLPNHYSTEYLAPVISKLAVQVSGMHLLPLTIDTLRFGLPETTSESIELMLKIAMPFVKPTLLSFIPLSPVVIYPTLVLGSAILGVISVNPEREVDNSLYDIVSNILQDNSDPVSLGMLAWSSALYMPGVSLPISIAVAVSTVATASYVENLLSENSNPVLGETNNFDIDNY